MFKWFKNKFSKDEGAEKPLDNIEIDEQQTKEEDEVFKENSELQERTLDNIKENTVEVKNKTDIEKVVEEMAPMQEENYTSEEDTLKDCTTESEKEVEELKEEPMSFFERLKKGLEKTRNQMGVKINTLIGAYVKIEDELLEDLEDVLISADVGMNTTMTLIDNLRETIINKKINDPNLVKPMLREEVKKLMSIESSSEISQEYPLIILVVGVNGVGKTTTIGKLASRYKKEGKKVLIAAADTFRAAAIDQLKTWGDRAGVDVISHSEGADPAAVIFDGISAARSRKVDILICDTAGRLHNKANLMKELEKINKVINRDYPKATRETLLVLDATTGQNAINQAKTFKEVCELTGIALTKLDGTAKGGVVIALQSELKIPIKLVGVGEKIEDLQDFNMDDFIKAIFE
ncbi:signal recognition particle-docking protein FtsY [Peptoniphilus sp. ING2-D1G]|nr:signal recognition particle-docking protein FtsY [Peptoniphilus sp. ING2-D1G]